MASQAYRANNERLMRRGNGNDSRRILACWDVLDRAVVCLRSSGLWDGVTGVGDTVILLQV